MGASVTAVLSRFNTAWATPWQPEAIIGACEAAGIPPGATVYSRPSPPSSSCSYRFCMAIPPAVICLICRAYGSARQPPVKPVPDSRYASLTSSWNASAAPCSPVSRTQATGMAIARCSWMARDAPCLIPQLYKRHVVSQRYSGPGAAFPWRACWGCFMPARACS